jgi:hypothetical protein
MALWTPAEITTSLWLDASDASTLYDATSGGSLVASDGTVARWEDKSGNDRHYTQATAGSRPTRKTSIQNGNDVIRFSNHFLFRSGGFVTLNSVAVFVVSKTDDDTVTTFQFAMRNSGVGTSKRLYFAGTSTETLTAIGDTTTTVAFTKTLNWHMRSFRHGSNSHEAWLNGTAGTPQTQTSTAVPERTSVGGLIAGVSDTIVNPHIGDIAEIIICPTAIVDADRQKVEGYLAWKWGLEGDLPAGHPYENAAPTIPSPSTRRRRYAGGYGL